SAASNSRRPMVTVIRPSRTRCVKETIPRHERAVLAFEEGQNAGCFHRYSRRQLYANAGIAAAEHGLLGCGVYDPTEVVSRGVDHDGNLRQPSGAGLAPIDRAAEQRDELAPSHSITSSASCCNCRGTLRPRAFAVLRLITSSNLVGCSTGRSAGLSPLRILPV